MKEAKSTGTSWLVQLVVVVVISIFAITAAFAETQSRQASDNSRRGSEAGDRDRDRDRDRDKDKDKPSTQPSNGRSDTPFNPWNDGRFDKGKIKKGRENQPFNPWGDDRYDPKPPKKPESNVKPGYVIPYYRWYYPDPWTWHDYYRGAPPPPYYRDDRDSRWDDRNDRRDRRDRIRNNRPGVTHRVYRYDYWGHDYDPNYSRSIYYYYGRLPYINRSRITILPRPNVTYNNTVINITNNYYLNQEATSSLDATLADIRTAWLDGRPELVDRHLSNGQMIGVLLDNKYDYSIEPADYIQMTADAMDEIDTVGFMWKNIKQRTNNEYTAFGQHSYLDTNGQQQNVYISYNLKRLGDSYVITEVGSSKQPLN